MSNVQRMEWSTPCVRSTGIFSKNNKANMVSARVLFDMLLIFAGLTCQIPSRDEQSFKQGSAPILALVLICS